MPVFTGIQMYQKHKSFLLYGNDIWIMPKTGGMAEKLSSPAGVESFPKFSPDGRYCFYAVTTMAIKMYIQSQFLAGAPTPNITWYA